MFSELLHVPIRKTHLNLMKDWIIDDSNFGMILVINTWPKLILIQFQNVDLRIIMEKKLSALLLSHIRH